MDAALRPSQQTLMEPHSIVSILVLVDAALRHKMFFWSVDVFDRVSILVLVDAALRPQNSTRHLPQRRVSILVLVDAALRLLKICGVTAYL